MMIVFAFGMSRPGFDDRRADEDVGGAVGEGDHHLLERALGHLAVPDDEPGVGQQPAELLGLRLDRLDPVVDVEDLAAAVELAQDRVADEPGRRLGDAGLDRQPVLRRRLDDAQVADPGERQVERPRDRRRRQRQDVHLAAELLEPLLGRDPEPLLLVDDDQARGPGTATSLRQQPVRPDDEVDGPVGQPLERRRLLLRRDEPRQQPDLERERREALAERRVVLGREHRRRDEDRDLLAVLGRLERGPQRDLGLAVADVADDEPVHRPDLLHVRLDLGRRRAAGRPSPRTGTRPPSRPATACRGEGVALGVGARGVERRAAPRRGRRRPCGRAAWCAATPCRRAWRAPAARRRRSG